MRNIVIVGNGIAGITAAREIRKRSQDSITVVSSESKYFFSRTALMYLYMGHMRFVDVKPYEDWFWAKNTINLVQDYVESVNVNDKVIVLRAGVELKYDILILATGSTWNRGIWPGMELEGVGGLVSLQDLEYMESHSKKIKRAVVIGGGLIGIEMVEMFLSRNIPVTFLVRENSFWNRVMPPEESAMINNHILEHHVDLRLSTEVNKIIGNAQGHVQAVECTNGEIIECDFVGLTMGVHPNISFLENGPIETRKGILVNEFFETNVPNVFAIGDCAEMKNPPSARSAIEQVWYTGKLHGLALAQNITERAMPYNPPPWHNAAKFFDLEWQVYGDISVEWPESVRSFFWQDESKKKAIRILYTSASGVVIGINVMGIRFRHKICEMWLSGHKTIEYVLAHLKAANFDPEFFSRHEIEIANQWNQQNPDKKVEVKSKSRLKNIIFGE